MSEELKLPYHRKYRPTTLNDYIGNEKLKRTAMASLDKQVKPQIILLQGASGCGKTTFARLLAKEYLCENRDNVTGACGKCASCSALDDYIHTGNTDYLQHVHEIDIADQSGKRDLEGIIEEIMIPAFGEQWEVYIFDECHMATPGAQNRLLKLAEEPPEFKLLIFCTTDPQMMLPTLVNRCQLQLKVVKPKVSELGNLLAKVCVAEGVDYDKKGVNFIANRADLTIRQALTSLERVINEKGSAKYDSAVEVFEEVSDEIIVQFYKKLIGTPIYNSDGSLKEYKRDVLGYVSLFYKIRSDIPLQTFLTNLIEFTKRGIYVVNQIDLDGVSDGELKIYRDLFGSFTVEQMALLIDKLLDLGSGDLETKLLLLGYTGLQTTTDKVVPALDKEISQEIREEAKNREEKKEEQEEESIKSAEEMIGGGSMDMIQALFGGTDVITDN